ncbi:MAG: hypothetical protein ACTSO9_05215 [Candidatus Helarchaeota archaeon]
MVQAFRAPKSEKGYIALSTTFIFVENPVLTMLLAFWIFKPMGIDFFAVIIISLIFAGIFILLGIIFIVKRETLLKRCLATADRIFEEIKSNSEIKNHIVFYEKSKFDEQSHQ